MKARATRSAFLCLALLVSLILPYRGRPTLAAAQAEDYTHRYVLFLGGVNSSSSREGEPIGGAFSVIRTKLQGQGFAKFVYFSYSAARFQRMADTYCNGWAFPSDVNRGPCEGFFFGDGLQSGNLAALGLNPVYTAEDTKALPIEQHAQTLDWLIGQIAERDPAAQIDLVGFSLGGIVASHWVATSGASEHREHVRSLVLLNSPVGGFPLFNAAQSCGFGDPSAFCWLIKPTLQGMFGDHILRQLQADTASESIVSLLEGAPRVAQALPITSIQSTNDYLVNAVPLTFRLVCGFESTATFSIGRGTQRWNPIRRVSEDLGGALALEEQCWGSVLVLNNFILDNHNAALHERGGRSSPAERAARLVLDAILSPGSTTQPTPEPSETTTPEPSETTPEPSETPLPDGQSAILALPTATGEDGCRAVTLPENDDGSSSAIQLPFRLNFAGTTHAALYVNTNGSVTFDAPLETYVPFDLQRTNRVIIAPFFADIDTRGPDGGTVTYSRGPVALDGRPAFCVNWNGVGSYERQTDRRNSFQLILIDRSDVGAGDFDIMFNYGQLQWDTASPTIAFPNTVPARAGYSNGSSLAYELPGSAIAGAFLDRSPATGLIYQTRDGAVPGQYVFRVRNGSTPAPVAVPTSGSEPAPTGGGEPAPVAPPPAPNGSPTPIPTGTGVWGS